MNTTTSVAPVITAANEALRRDFRSSRLRSATGSPVIRC